LRLGVECTLFVIYKAGREHTASSTTKTGRHDIAEIFLKMALNTKNQIKIKSFNHLAFQSLDFERT
jgi:hypothetical protein